MVTVVGIGPGHADYMTAAAVKRIARAEVVLGAPRVLDVVDTGGKEVVEITGHLDAALGFIDANRERDIVVVVGGDPGFYSILRTIRERLPGVAVDAVPGISPVQLLFARIGEAWHGVVMTSAHGRTMDELDAILARHKRVCVLTDQANSAPAIARHLMSSGFSGRAVAGERLSYEDERIVDTTLAHLSELEGFGSSVLYIEIDG